LICVAFIGVPIMMAEALIGRAGRRNAPDSLRVLAEASGHSGHWKWIGYLGMACLVVILSFYSVIAGWALAYLTRGIKGLFYGRTPTEVVELWNTLLNNPSELLIWHSLFMAMTIAVVSRGVHRGLERASRLMLPILLILLVMLVIYAMTTGDAKAALQYMFAFRLEDLTPQTVIAAMGHSFFTLALGAGAIMAYGAYTSEDTHLPSAISLIVILDTVVALLAGLAIFPIVFAHGLQPESGPGLMFTVLPIAFSEMPFGNFLAVMFFALLLISAWTSSINMAEPVVALMIEKLKAPRKLASYLVGLICWLLGIGSLLSFNLWSDVSVFGSYNFFEFVTMLPDRVILPVGGFAFALFAGWVMNTKTVRDALCINDTRSFRFWYFLMRYIAPAAIAVVFLNGLLNG
jgi:NSS family neurotransmitter:Na+ symporter